MQSQNQTLNLLFLNAGRRTKFALVKGLDSSEFSSEFSDLKTLQSNVKVNPVISWNGQNSVVDFLKESRWLYDRTNRTGCRDGVPSLPRSIVTDHGEATIDLETLTRTSADVTLKCHEPRTYARCEETIFNKRSIRPPLTVRSTRGSGQIAASRSVGCGVPASSFFDTLTCVSWPRRPTLYASFSKLGNIQSVPVCS